MEIIHGLDKLGVINEPVLATLGAFDGVHLAHLALIKKLTDEYKKTECKSVLITFEPLPRSLFNRDEGFVLTSLRHKLDILEKTSLDMVVVIRFTQEFAEISAWDFLEKILLHHFPELRKLVVGPRAHFGKNAGGNTDFLKNAGLKLGFEVDVVEEMIIDDAVVSSSVIRKLIRSGELETAAMFLGRKYSIYGKVIRGERIGRKLGFPTANIDPENEVHPPSGVYAVEIRIGKSIYPAVLNIGFRPTLAKRDDLEPAIEAHIINFDRKIYRKLLEVIFHFRLRQEKRFVSADELVKQIKTDLETARAYFNI